MHFDIKNRILIIKRIFGIRKFVLLLIACCYHEQVIYASELPEVTIAVVRDGDSWFFDALGSNIEAELTVLIQDKVKVTFDRDPAFNANWDISRIQSVLRNALDDPEVDIILTQGHLVMRAASSPNIELSKPVAGGYFQDAQSVGLLISPDGFSNKKNLNLVVSNKSVPEEIAAFKDMAGFKTLHALITREIMEGFEGIEGLIQDLEQRLGIKIVLTPMAGDTAEVLSRLPSDTEAVYIFPLLRMSERERLQLIGGLNARNIPTFAFIGLPSVERGVLAGMLPDVQRQIARRSALNIQQMIAGVSPNELPIFLSVEQRLYLNARTAAQIDFDPPFSSIRNVTYVDADDMGDDESLDLRKAIKMALETNYDYLIQKQITEINRHNKQIAFSPLLPQVNSSYSFTEIDEDRAAASAGNAPLRSNQTGIKLQQLIFNDSAISNFRASREAFKGSEWQEESLRLNVVQAVGVAYIRYLSARTLLFVARDNLKITRSNLDLARTRLRIGTSGPEDVYRFEAQEAADQIDVANAQSGEQKARVALNQAIGIDLNKKWRARDLTLSSPEFDVGYKRVSTNINSNSRLEALQEFLIAYSLEHSPELAAIDHSIRAQTIVLKQKKRQFYVPSVGAQFSYDRILNEDFNSTSPVTFGPDPDDDEWSFFVTVSLPIFEGTRRRFEVLRDKATLRQLQHTRDQIRQLVETRVQQAFFSISSSFPTIEFSTRAADRAEKNLNVVTDKYEQGVVNIIDLLDAQSQAFVQRQNAALAVYNLFEDFVQVQRSIAWFEFTKTQSEKVAWERDLDKFISKNQ